MSPLVSDTLNLEVGFPRVSGDEPCSSPPATFTALFSPRERG